MLEIDEKIFNDNLLLTQAYCELQLQNSKKDTASILRSFNPLWHGKELFSFEMQIINGTKIIITKWQVDPFDIYHSLFEEQLLHKKNNLTLPVGKIQTNGKILAADIDITIIDGASEFESDGLIDSFDCPPIDTWFYLTVNKDSRTLFAWIPEQFVALVNIAIAVNCVEGIYWYGEKINNKRTKSNYFGTIVNAFLANFNKWKNNSSSPPKKPTRKP